MALEFAEADVTSVTPNAAAQFGINAELGFDAASLEISEVGGNPALAQLASIVAQQANDRVPPAPTAAVDVVGPHTAAIAAAASREVDGLSI